MKRLLVTLLLAASWFWAQPASAAATLKQVVGNCYTSSTTTCVVTPGTGIVAGDALVVLAGGSLSNNTIASVTGTGHTFTVVTNIGGAGNPWGGVAVECSSPSGTAAITVNLTSSPGGGGTYAYIYEAQGNAVSACNETPVGQVQASPGTGTNGITSGAIASPAANGELFVGMTFAACCTPPTVSLGTNVAWGNLQQQNDGAVQFSGENFAQATAASIAADFTQGTNIKALTIIVGIKPSGGGGSTPSGNLILLGVGP